METKLGFSIEILGAQDAVVAAEELRRSIADVQKELKKASDTKDIERLGKQLVDLKAKQAEVNKEVREQVKARQEELTKANQAGVTYRELSKRLNDLRNRYKDMAAAEQEATKEAQDLISEITILDRRLKKIDGDVGQFNRNVGDYTGALSQFFPRLGGSIGDVSDSLGFLKGQTTGLGKGFGGLLVATTVFSAVSDLVAGLNQQLQETRKLQAEIATLTGQTGEALQQGVAQAQAIGKTYGESAQEIAVAANTVSKELGINFADALSLVEVGFRKGANAQGEFLDTLREYPAQFRDAGASARDFLAISIAAAQEGVYSDKGLDAVKEFGLRIREQTKTTRDALNGALGKEFTEELFANLNNGSTTSVQALGKVTTALKENGVQGAQLQTVIADVFGAPGEDVGQRFLFTLGDILEAQGDLSKSTNEYQTQQEKLYESNNALIQSQLELTNQFINSANEITILQNAFQLFLNKTALNVLRFFDELPQSIAGVNAFFKSIADGIVSLSTFGFAGAITNPFKEARLASVEARRQVRKDNEKAQKEDEKAKAEAASRATRTEAGLQKKLAELRQKRAQAIIGSAEFKTLDAEIKKIEQSLRKAVPGAGSAGKTLSENFVAGSIAALQNEKGKLEKALENTIGEAAQRRVIASIAAIEARLEQQLQNIERLRLEGERAGDAGLRADLPGIATRDLTDVQIARTTEKAKTDAVFKEVQKRAELRKKEIEDSVRAEKERKERVISEVQGYTEAAFQLLSAFSARRQELDNRRYEEEISKTEANIQELENKAQNASGIRQRILQKQVVQQQEILKKQQKEAEALQKKQAKAEKKIAIAQSIIQGTLAVLRALNTFPGPPITIPTAIATGVFAAAQTATIIAQPLATGGIVGISGRRVNDRQNMPTRANGDNVLATVKRGEVVLNQRQQSALGGAPVFRSIGVPGFAAGGAIGAPNIAAIRGGASDSTALLKQLDAKTDAINARIDRLKAFVVTEEIARDMQEASNLKIQATL